MTKRREPDLGVEGPSSKGSRTHCSESLMEAAKVTPLLTSKTITKIASWSIRAMYKAGKAAQVAAEKNNYTVSLLALHETRWTQDK